MKSFFKRPVILSLALAFALLPAATACNSVVVPEDPDTSIEEPDDVIPENPDNPDGPETPDEPDDPETPDPVYEIRFEQSELQLAAIEGYNEATLSAGIYCDGELLEDVTPTFSVADESVATADGATLTATGAGNTIVTAYYTVNDGTVSESIPLDVLGEVSADDVNSFNEDAVNVFGRTYITSKKITFDNVCTGVEVAFAGTKLTANLSVSSESLKSKVRVYVDGDTTGTALVLSNTKAQKTVLCEKLEDGIHTVRILKAASPMYGRVYLPDSAGAFETDGTFLAVPEKSELKIEFIGDSITAGAGANGTSAEVEQTVENSDPTLAFAYLTAQALNADFSIMALEGICAKDGATNSYDLYNRYSPNKTTAYDASSFDADIVVLALGENDVWHATSDQFPNYDLTKFRADYADMLRLIRTAHPNAKIVCVFGMMPASARVEASQNIKAAIADTGDDNITTLQLLTNEKGANYHPNAATHKTNAAQLAKHITALLGK